MSGKAKKSTPEHLTNPIDKYVGMRMRIRRENFDYSQQYLARKLGLTFQQIQKYENGGNRLAASRLFDVSKVLKVGVEYFFENMPEDVFKQSNYIKRLSDEEYKEVYQTVSQNIYTSNETFALVNAYNRITNRALARQMLDMVVGLANLSTSDK